MEKEFPADAVRIGLDRLYKEFSKTGNSIIALQAFLLAHKAKQSIPEWAIDQLACGIDSYLKGNVDSLDPALGLKQCGKGRRTHPVEKVSNERRDSDLVFYMVILEKLFGYKAQEAITAVYNKLGPELMLSERTLANLHAKKANQIKVTFKKLMQNMDIKTAKKLWSFLI